MSSKRIFILGIIFGIAFTNLVLLAYYWIEGATLFVAIAANIGGVVGGVLVGFMWRAVYKYWGAPSRGQIVKTMTINQAKESNVEYELNIKDVLAFVSYNSQQSPAGRARAFIRYIYLGIAIILACIAIFLWVFVNQLLVWAKIFSIGAVLMLAYYIFSPLLTKKLVKQAILKSYGQGKNKLIGKHKFSITPTAVTDITDMGETRTRWDVIKYMATTDQYLFLTALGSDPHIVPKRAFADDEAFRQFAETATAYHQASVAQQAETPP